MPATIQQLKKQQISGRVEVTAGNGGLPKIVVATKSSAAEIYLHGAHVTHFQKTGEPPLIFVSRKSHFNNGDAIRGGVPVIFPWFGNRDGEPSHGFARTAEWQLIKTSADEKSAGLHLALPRMPGRDAWNGLRTEFIVTVADTLTMELTTTNESCGHAVEIENCLHTYFRVGDIRAVSVHGLEGAAYLNFAEGDNGVPRAAEGHPLTINRETNRTYCDTQSAVEIRDENLKRVIRVEKSGSQSTVVWNPWTTQKMSGDFDPAEHAQMICVESGNVKQNRISLPPGKTTSLKVVLGSSPWK